eukprot:gene9569-9731_t
MRHLQLAIFGVVGVGVVGIIGPFLAGLLLWLNRGRLDDWNFAWKFCFLYSEYREVYCFWEFVIMARKLLFLAATILLPMAVTAPEDVIAQLQLQVCVMMGVVFLLVHTSLQPFRRGLLNRLERLSLATIALSFCLLSIGVSVHHKRVVTMTLLLLLNGSTILYFLVLIGRELWGL